MSTAITSIIRKAGLNPEKVRVDSVNDLELEVRPCDVARAKRKQPDCCVLARAACRSMPDVAEAWFWPNAVYVHQLQEDGSGKFIRFIPSREAKKEIAHFDETGEFRTGKFKLLAPKGSKTMKAIKKRSAKRPGRHQPANSKIKRGLVTSQRANWSEAK